MSESDVWRSATASEGVTPLRELARIARHHLGELMEPSLALADDLLFELADQARSQNEQRMFFDAMRVLRHHRSAIVEGTLDRYLAAFRDLDQGAAATGRPSYPVSEEDLELLANDALEEMIALDNIAYKARASGGRALEFLCERFESLVGAPVNDVDNPFLGEPLCEAFAAELRALELDQRPKLRVFRLFEHRVMKHWPDLVAECNRYLIAQGVLPDLEKRKPGIRKQRERSTPSRWAWARTETASAEGAAEPSRPADADRSAEAGQGRGERESNGIGNRPESSPFPPGLLAELHRQLQRQAGGAESSSAGGGAVSNEELLDALAGSRRDAEPGEGISEEDLELLREKGLEGAIDERLRACEQNYEALAESSRSVIQLLDRSFGRITSRELVPDELNGLVLRLEIPVASMALRDPAFLESLNHPGRRLINEVFRVSTTFLDGEDASEDPLRREVDKLIDRLAALDVTPRELTRLLSEFIEFVERDKKRQALRERRLMEEEEASARTVQAHTEVHRALLERVRGHTVPRFLVRFCESAWSKVLFLHALRDGVGSGEWQTGLTLLDELLAAGGSPEEGDAQLLAAVSERLQGINLPPPAVARWEGLLRDYLAGQGEADEQAMEPISVDNLLLGLPGVSLLEESNDEAEVDIRALERIDALGEGVWVEFQAADDSEPIRCKLAGVVKPLAKYVFTNRRGVKVAEASRRQLAERLKAGGLRVMDNARLFDRAFEDVVEEIRARSRRQGAARP